MERNRDIADSAITNQPPWDEMAAVEAAGGDANLARELLEALTQGLPNEVSDLRRAFQTHDWPMLTETAHRIRGAASYCGVPALDTALHDLERTAKTGDPERIGYSFRHVEEEAVRLMHTIGQTE